MTRRAPAPDPLIVEIARVLARKAARLQREREARESAAREDKAA